MVDAGGDIDLYGLAFAHCAGAAAIGAGLVNEPAGAAALAAGTIGGENAHGGLPASLHGAGAVAIRADFGCGAGRTAISLTGRALLTALQGDGFLAAEGRLRKADGDAGPDAFPPLGGVGVAALTAAESTAEKAAEDVAQVTKVEAAAISAAPGSRAVVRIHPGEAELVVPGFFLGIGQDLIGLVDLLELLLGLFIAGVHVRVVFPGQLFICFFDFILRGALLDAQHLVIIYFFSHKRFLPSGDSSSFLTPQGGAGILPLCG